jgi:hypothetical protein
MPGLLSWCGFYVGCQKKCLHKETNKPIEQPSRSAGGAPTREHFFLPLIHGYGTDKSRLCDLELCGDRWNASVEIEPVPARSRDQNPPVICKRVV